MSLTQLRDQTSTNCSVFLSSSIVTHPRTQQQYHEAFHYLTQNNIGTILSMTSGEVATIDHLRMYSEKNIFYEQLPMHDELVTPPNDIQEKVLNVYKKHVQRHGNNRSLLINCSAGINRSALAAAIILWHTTTPRPWKSAKQLIHDMRTRQLQDRDITFMLTNDEFYNYLLLNLK